MIKHVLLDLDDTVFDFGKAERIALTGAFERYGVSVTDELLARYSELNSDCWASLERGEIDLKNVLIERFKRLFNERGISAPAVEVNTLYERLLGIGHYFTDCAEEVLAELKRDYSLYIASNGTSNVQKSRLASAGIEPLFDGVFISEDIGYFKPDKRFFDCCFKRIPDFSSDRTVMVGDRLSSDIVGGINAGIKTVWYNPSGIKNESGLTPTAEIRDLRELPALLKTL